MVMMDSSAQDYSALIKKEAVAEARIASGPPTRSKVLTEAEQAINGDRNADYGDPTQDFRRTASFWNTYLMGVLERKLGKGIHDVDPRLLATLGELIDTWDVAEMMILLKVSRSTVTPQKRDHWVDMAGYVGCGAECVDSHMGGDLQ